jgi:hypothetical protein
MTELAPGRRDLLCVAALYAAATALYAWLGVRFDDSTLPTGMQFIDTRLLTERLLESIWFYHANPPLLNLFAGIGQKVFGAHAGWFYTCCFHVLGLMVAFTIYTLTKELSASRIAAHLVTALLVFSPSFVLYENWFLYSFPAMALLTFSALALYRYVQTRDTRWCVSFFALLATLLLTRSLFHLAWMALITVLLVVILRECRKQVLVAAAFPLLIVALWYGKNYYYFGTFSSSTWMGLGLSNMTTLMLPREELQPLVARRELSPWALVSRYDPRGLVFLGQLRPPAGVPVLDQMVKESGVANWNYRDLVSIDRYYSHDGLAVARHFPASYVLGVYMANRLYFSPTSMNPYFSDANREAARPMERVFVPLLNGVTAEPGTMIAPHYGFRSGRPIEVNTSVPLILVWITVLGFGYVRIRKDLVNGTQRIDPGALVLGFIVVTAAYLYVVSTTLDMGENYRYRFVIEPLFSVVAATAATAGIRALRRWRTARNSATMAVAARTRNSGSISNR